MLGASVVGLTWRRCALRWAIFRDAVSRSFPLEVRVEVPVDPQVQRRIQDGVSLGDLGFGGFSLFLGGSRLRRKGRQPPGLNFGDLFAYALARASGEELLITGNDLTKTDITVA